MKKLIALIVFSIISISLIAQDLANDIIYPADNSNPINNCKIIKISGGNLVFYKRNGIEQMIEAIALKKDGQYIELNKVAITPELTSSSFYSANKGSYKGKDYDYYFNEHIKAQSRKITGIVLTFSGLAFSVIGLNKMMDNIDETGNITGNEKEAQSGTLMYLGGVIMTSIGIPLWISGTIKDNNNKMAMRKCTGGKASLNLGITNDGIGLVYKF